MTTIRRRRVPERRADAETSAPPMAGTPQASTAAVERTNRRTPTALAARQTVGPPVERSRADVARVNVGEAAPAAADASEVWNSEGGHQLG